MKKILFIACLHGNDLAGHKLFQDYPYGQTDKAEWDVLIGNPYAVMLNTPYVESDISRAFNVKNPKTHEEKYAQLLKKKFNLYDEVFDIRSTPHIGSSAWDDTIYIGSTSRDVLDLCQFIETPHILSEIAQPSYKETLLANHPRAVSITYQKTYDVYSDYERILADFERIVHREPVRAQEKKVYERISTVTQEQKRASHLEFENFHELSSDDKSILGFSNEKQLFAAEVDKNMEAGDSYCSVCRKI